MVLSLLLVLGIAPRLVLFLLWAGYLSLCTVAANFLGYQWDSLLVESLFVALFLAPPGWRERLAPAPPAPTAAFLLARLVLFKLVFLSGFVKLASGDPTWRGLTALDFHSWTQPLPTWTSAFAAALPHAVQATSVLATLALELALPFLLFAPRRARHLGALALVAFQLLLMSTGNFAFFNLLTIVLCLPALDDALLARAHPRRLRARLAPDAVRAERRPSRVGGVCFAGGWAVRLAANALLLAQRLPSVRLSERAVDALQAIAPWRIANGYGLFAVMTTERPEILVEGSRDGTTWLAYEFRWKPGRLDRAPGFVAPHQPRLDWEMWFAALRGCRRSPWFARFALRLLEGSEPVLALLEANPFPAAPPRAIRSTVHRYRFAPPAQQRSTGRWWIREEPGAPFCPTFRSSP